MLDGKIVSQAVEVNAVWHCNIRCRWCSHGSPYMPPIVADPKLVGNDLRTLAQWMHLDHVRVLGGEPLLHPRLPELLMEIKSAEISDRTRILTNGLLLHKVPLGVWQSTDEIHISVYPNTVRSIEARMPKLQDIAATTGTSIVLKYFDHFRVCWRIPDNDHYLTQRIFQTCQVANHWRCITVEQGQLFRCPQSAFFHTLKDANSEGSARLLRERLDIAHVRSAYEIQLWLARPTALSSCRHCAGSIGKRLPHRQSNPKEIVEITSLASLSTVTRDEAIDHDYLRSLETDITKDNGCVSQSVMQKLS